jgi:hypothetical protein
MCSGKVMKVLPIYPSEANSTMFTECCQVAICSYQANCPHCGRPVIGHDLSEPARRRLRWWSATAHWRR